MEHCRGSVFFLHLLKLEDTRVDSYLTALILKPTTVCEDLKSDVVVSCTGRPKVLSVCASRRPLQPLNTKLLLNPTVLRWQGHQRLCIWWLWPGMQGVHHFVCWCEANHLYIKTTMTREMVINFRKVTPPMPAGFEYQNWGGIQIPGRSS